MSQSFTYYIIRDGRDYRLEIEAEMTEPGYPARRDDPGMDPEFEIESVEWKGVKFDLSSLEEEEILNFIAENWIT